VLLAKSVFYLRIHERGRMLPFTSCRKKLTWSLVLALCGVTTALILPVAQVSANGSHVGIREVFSGPAGPYDLKVVTAPMVGTMHLTVYVARTDDSNPVSDAQVQITGQGPKGALQTVGPIPAIGSMTTLYTVDLPIKETGEWIFTLTVESSLDEATVDFPVKVPQQDSISWVAVLIGALLLAQVLWFGMKTLRQKATSV
jgi:hypothetical protein